MSFKRFDFYQNQKTRNTLFSKGGTIDGDLKMNGDFQINGNLDVNSIIVNGSNVGLLKKYYAVVDFETTPLAKKIGVVEDLNSSYFFPYVNNSKQAIATTFFKGSAQDIWYDDASGNIKTDVSGNPYMIKLSLYNDEGNAIDYIPKNEIIQKVITKQLEKVVGQGESSLLTRDAVMEDTGWGKLSGYSDNSYNALSYGISNVITDNIAMITYKNGRTNYYGSNYSLYESHHLVPLYASLHRDSEIRCDTWLGDYDDFSSPGGFSKDRNYVSLPMVLYRNGFASGATSGNVLAQTLLSEQLKTNLANNPISERAVDGQSIFDGGEITHPTHYQKDGKVLGYMPHIWIHNLSSKASPSNSQQTPLYWYSGGVAMPDRDLVLNKGKLGFIILTENVGGSY